MDYLKEKHLAYLDRVSKNRDLFSYGSLLREHLNLPGAYWAITSCFLMKKKIEDEEKEGLIKWLLTCQNKDHGFGGNTGHDSQITSTLYALIVLMLFDSLDQVNLKDITAYVMSLYDEKTGAFKGDRYGEKDGRFVYSALYILKITKADMPAKSLDFIKKCFNYDGGFGGAIDAESHAAYIFCAVGALCILDKVDVFNRESIKKILAIRQTSTGGFNGRPEKLPDVCYSWWVLASVAAIGEIDDINLQSLENYILSCQDKDDGGFSDRPGNGTDVFHTFFALSALSLIDSKKYELIDVDPVYAIPTHIKTKYIDN